MASRLLNQAPVYINDLGAPVAGGQLRFFVNGTATPKNVYGDKALTVNLGSTENLDSAGRQVADIWLDGAYSVELRDASNNLIWERDDVEAPSELPSQAGNAGKALVTNGTAPIWQEIDTLPDFSAADPDDVLKIVGGVPLFGSPPIVNDYLTEDLARAAFVNCTEKAQSVTATGTTSISYSAGSIVQLTQDVNITSLVLASFGSASRWARMVIIRTKDATATPRTIAWGSVRWAGGTAPTLSSAASAVDIIELWSNGTVIYGFSRGLAFA